jgi:ABC-2 type transport system permease protein
LQAILRDLGLWFWRLVPANPILVRVVSAGGKRTRHLWIRVGYLAILAISVVVGVIVTQSGSTSLAELAKEATGVFKSLSIIQLGMVCVLAPIFAAAAITQEKDSQTYNILLSTPLTNGQIVLGSLLSRLFFVFALLVAGIPLFCIMMVYGGVTGDKIGLSIGLAGATALITGTLAITISVVKIGTGRTIFSFYLAIAVYLIVAYSLSFWRGLIPPEAVPAPGQSLQMSWLAAFHPFLALQVVLGETPAPEIGAVMHYGFPGQYLLAYPQYSFIVLSVLLSAALVALSLFFVRRSTKEGEASFFSRLIRGRTGAGSHGAADSSGDDQRRKPRHVRRNPISWRESVTGAAAGGGLVGRYVMLGVGLALGMVFSIVYAVGNLNVADARAWLLGIVAVELGITLFVATTTAATSMTREKESNTLELLLATPLTSAKIITGKISGLVWAAGPMLLVPYLTVSFFVVFDLFAGRLFEAISSGGGPVVGWESMLTLPVLLIAFTAFACMIGLEMSIKCKKTITAVFYSMAIVIGVFAVSGGCAFMMQDTGDQGFLTAALMPLTPITACFMAINPEAAVSASASLLSNEDLVICRVVAFIASFASAAVYFLVGVQRRKAMVRDFDMVIRKQTS